MTFAAIVSILLLPWAVGVVRAAVGAVLLAAGLACYRVVLPRLVRGSGEESTAARFWADTRRAVFSADAFAAQLVSALSVVGSYIAVFVVAARAVGVETPIASILPLVAPVLMTMLIPLTVAGWGIREAAATALWGLTGLTPEDGAAISVTYGLLVLVSSAPGLAVLMQNLIGGRGRTAGPPRA
jgi:uncharacterized membrane protein YbhN (UPF0104 family)